MIGCALVLAMWLAAYGLAGWSGLTWMLIGSIAVELLLLGAAWIGSTVDEGPE